MPHKKGHPAPRSVAGAAKTESTGNVGKPKAGEKRYSSGAPARGTQTRKDILADMQRLVNYVKTGKFKNYKEKQKVWAQIDNFRVALGTLKEDKRKSKSNATGVTTYGGGAIKVRKEAGFSRDSGRGGGRKSTQMADGGKGKVTPKPPKPPTPPTPPTPKSQYPNPMVGSAMGGKIADNKQWRFIGDMGGLNIAGRPSDGGKNPIVGSASGGKIADKGSYRPIVLTPKKKKNKGGR